MDTEQFESVAQALQEDPSSEEALDAAETLVAQQAGDALLRTILVQKSKNSEQHVAVADAMTLFELIIENRPRLGQYLMLRLYPVALLAYRHDVADAIGLWITSQPSAELAQMIQRVAFTERNAGVRQEYMEWASAMSSTRDNS